MKLIYTNYGILTEERVRELKEYGYGVEECGMAGEMAGPPMRMGGGYMGDEVSEPVTKVVILEPGQDGVIEEGGMASTAGTQSYSSNQGVVEVGPQGGIAGSAASGNPGGANVPDPMEKRGEPRVVISPSNDLKEAFNRRAEALLEAWLEEEAKKEEKDELHGDQDELDVAPPFGKLTGTDFKNLGKKSAHKAGHKEKD